jgi:hypothetical protein
VIRDDILSRPRLAVRPTRHGRSVNHLRLGRPVLFGAALAIVAATVAGCGHTSAAPTWQQVGKSTVNSLTGAEGLASRADDSLLHRGLGSVPAKLRLQGWSHVGDPDIISGDTFDAYQAAATKKQKLFTVTTSGGTLLEYTHALDPGELFNNSFDTVSPDGQWLVSGEFGEQHRLQVFPAPLLNHSTPVAGGALPQAGQIALNTPVTNIQGCDFVTATELVCSADDAAKDVVRLDLPGPLDGKATTAAVTTLFQIPRVSKCTGTFEAEGIDYDVKTKLLHVQIVSPGLCKGVTTILAYRLQDAPQSKS